MTERPILFSGAMVRAILAGRKTQTRRVVKPPAGIVSLYRPFPNEPTNVQGVDLDGLIGWYAAPSACPYGVPGDRLWVKERHCFLEPHRRATPQQGFAWDVTVEYSDGTEREIGGNGPMPKATRERGEAKWRPSIFMPRAACRLMLELTAVRIERLQEISEDDAWAEGISQTHAVKKGDGTARQNYSFLWNSLNAKRAPWASNPWVWVIEFKTT